MGQSHVCQPVGTSGAGGEGGAGSSPALLRSCSCLPSDGQTQESVDVPAGEFCVSSKWNAKPEKVWADDHFDDDTGSVVSDYDDYSDVKSSHLLLARNRLFSPHLTFKFGDYYQTERKIGEGSYGNVYQAVARPVDPTTGRPPSKPGDVCWEGGAFDQAAASSRRVAVKTFSLERKGGEDGRDAAKNMREIKGRRDSFEAERSILAGMEHPHIVRMYECFEERNTLYIVVELCRGGELYERIAQKAQQGGPGGLEEDTSRMLFRQMLYAVSYLHSNRVVHRDIKSENFLLLGEQGSREGDFIKLCDFGTAVSLSDQKPRSMERIGTLSYTAPEIYANRGADMKADAWSLGVVLYVLLIGASPFRTTMAETREETMRRIQNGDFEQRRPAWHNLSHEARELIQQFLVVEEAKRLTSSQALRHTWVEPGVPASPRGTPLSSYLSSFAPAALAAFTRFTQLDGLQQLTLTVCALLISEADIMRSSPVPWYELFFKIDKNEDGKIDMPEFVEGLKVLLGSNCDLRDEQLEVLGRSLDVDRSGFIEWIEWVAVALVSIHGFVEECEPLNTAFRLLDRPSGDFNIGAADLLAVLNIDVDASSKAPGDTSGGRDQILRILSRWGPRQKKGKTNGMVTSPASLQLADVRRVLESVISCEEVSIPPTIGQRTPGPRVWLRSDWACPPTAYQPSWCAGVTKVGSNEMQVVHQRRATSRPESQVSAPMSGQTTADRNTSRASAAESAISTLASRDNSRDARGSPR